MRHLAEKHRQNKTGCNDCTVCCICSVLNQPQCSRHSGSKECCCVCSEVHVNMGASVESSKCEECAFRAGCLMKLMSEQMCGASEEACCVKKQVRDIPETLQYNMGQKMRHC